MLTTNPRVRTAAAGRCVFALLLSLSPLTPAQEKTAPEPVSPTTPAPTAANATTPAPAPQTAMEKWLANTDAQWQATFKRDINDVYDGQLKKLSDQYAAALEAAFKKAGAAGDLEASVGLRDELKRFTETKTLPEQDTDTSAAAVKQARATYRAQVAPVEKDRAAHAAALHAKYDLALSQAQTQLTQHSRLDDAMLVKKKREELAAAWQQESPGSAPLVAPEETPKNPTPTPRASMARAASFGFTAILDKSHTDGWRHIGGGDMVVEDGVATSMAPDGAKGLYVYEKSAFKDFILKLEFSVDTETSNSGIVFRFPDPGNNFSITTDQGYEVDIIGAQTGQIIDPPTLHRLPKLVKLKPGAWNECEVTVTGHEITVKLNGQTVNRCMGKRALQGYLGLQNWKGEGSVHFRNVEIKNLSPNETTNTAMKALTP